MERDFSKGKVSSNIIAQAIPLILAQLVQLLYNVVDRIYIGHLPGAESTALTGVGLVFPLTTFIAAVTFLFGTGGAPLFPLPGGQGRKRGQKRFWEILSPFCFMRPWFFLCSAMCSAGPYCIFSAPVTLLMSMRTPI